MKWSKLFKLKLQNHHRLLIGKDRYIVFEKPALFRSELQDWMLVNTLLTERNVKRLFANRALNVNNGRDEEWYMYIPAGQPLDE